MKKPLHLHVEMVPGSIEESQELCSVKTSVQLIHKRLHLKSGKFIELKHKNTHPVLELSSQ